MPAIGNGHPIISLIQKKTKIKRCDIIHVLRCLPHAIPEAFLEANLPVNTPMDFGGFSVRWRVSKRYGAYLKIKPVKSMSDKLRDLKLEGKTPLAKHFFELMNPINQQIVVESAKKRTSTTKKTKF